VVAAVIAVWRRGEDVRSSVEDMGAGPMVFSAGLALLGTHATAMVWLRLARGSGLVAPTSSALALYYVSQLGKYIPGSVWPVVAQVEFGRRWSSPRRVLLAAYALVVAMLCATGLTIGLTTLVFAGGAAETYRYWWLVLVLPALLACLHPRIVPRVLDGILALAGRERLEIEVRPAALIEAAVWAIVAWILLGLHLVILLAALGESGADMVVTGIGAMALGWAAGLLVVFAPAGLGVRDSILVAAFAGMVGGGPALAVAVASRVLLLLSDLVLGGLGLLLTTGSKSAP
jgi:hypothetical protein